MSDVGSPDSQPLDARLLPAAGAVWGASYLALGWSPASSFLAAGVGVLLAVGGLVMRRGWATVLAAAAGCAAAALLVTGLRVVARDGSPLAGLARDHATADLLLTVQDDPRPLAVRGTGSGGPEVLVPARADHVTASGRAWRLSARVLVFAPAEGWQALLPSQQLRVRGRLGPPLGGDLTVAVLSTRGPPDAVGPPSWTQRAAGRLRAGLREAAGGLPSGADGLLPGLVVGDTSTLDPVLAADFRTTGLSHLVAVSGANLVFVVGAVLLLLRLFNAGPRLSATAGGLATLGFVVLARPSPSVLRAAVMGGLTLVALACGRPRAVLPALAAGVLGLLLWHPELARSPGFALSALATAGLIVLAPGWADRLRGRGVPRGVAEALAVAAAACLVTAPLIAALGGMVSTVAVPANLLAAPAVPPATVLGVLAAVLSAVWAGGAHAVALLAGLPAAWIVAIAEHGAALPAAAVSWPGGATGGSILCGALVALAWAGRYAPVRRAALAAAVGALLIALPAQALDPAWPPAGWLLVACDVGQGDALVLAAGPGAAVVVDTGPDPAAVDGCLRRLDIRRIPLLVLTHLHADHIGGLPGVLHGRQVGAIEIGPLHEPAWAWRSVLETAGGRRIRLLTGAVGETREVAGVRLTVLAPRVAFRGTRSDPNNSSLVLRVVSRGHVLLLTGDAEIEAQRALLREDPGDLPAEILKVPHHGSAYSDRDFLAAVHAQVGIISVGAHNDYGHPSPLLLAELARLGVRALRTDTAGDVAVRDQDGRLEVAARARGPPSASAARRSVIAPCQDAPVTTAVAAAIRLVLGDEELLCSRAVSEVVDRARANDPDCDVRDLAAAGVRPADLYDLLSPSLFGERRVVVLRGAHEAGKDLAEAVLGYVADPAPEVSLVVVHSGSSRGKALADGLRAAGADVVLCARLTRADERLEFIRAEVARAGGAINAEGAAVLLEAVGSDLRELATVCAQLVNDTGGRIDAAAVARYHRGRAEVSGFMVADRAVIGDVPGALEALRWAMAIGVPHVLVADALADGVRTIARVIDAGRANPHQLAGTLGMPPWKVRRAQSQARGWSESGLRSALRLVADVNADVKGVAADPSYALERAVIGLARARRVH